MCVNSLDQARIRRRMGSAERRSNEDLSRFIDDKLQEVTQAAVRSFANPFPAYLTFPRIDKGELGLDKRLGLLRILAVDRRGMTCVHRFQSPPYSGEVSASASLNRRSDHSCPQCPHLKVSLTRLFSSNLLVFS